MTKKDQINWYLPAQSIICLQSLEVVSLLLFMWKHAFFPAAGVINSVLQALGLDVTIFVDWQS